MTRRDACECRQPRPVVSKYLYSYYVLYGGTCARACKVHIIIPSGNNEKTCLQLKEPNQPAASYCIVLNPRRSAMVPMPSSMDDIINKLDEWNQHTRSAKGMELVDRVGSTRDNTTTPTPTPDLTSVDPTKLVGLVIKKDFDGFGLCEGTVRSVDVEVGTNRVLFTIEYVDGDTEGMFLFELVKFLRVDGVIIHLC